MPKSRFCCHSVLILYVFVAKSFKFQADFCCLFVNNFDLILDTSQILLLFSLFHFISFFRTFRPTTLDFFTSKSDSSSSSSSLFYMTKPLFFAFLFQNQVLDSSSLSFVSAILSLSSFISGYVLKIELASDFLFLQAWTVAAFADLSWSKWRLDSIGRWG